MEYFLIKNHQPPSYRLLLLLLLTTVTLIDLSWSQAPPPPPAPPSPTDRTQQTLNATERPWLRICQGKDRYKFEGSACVGGYMFNQPFPAGSCVCGNGIWILKAGYCDTTGKTYVIFADGNDCFKINSPIRWVRYVGHPEKANLNSHYLISGDWDYVEALHKNGPSHLVVSRTIWTMAVGDAPDNNNIYLPEEKLCFKSEWRPLGTNPTEDGRPYVRIGMSVNPSGSSNSLYGSNGDYPTPHQAQRLSYCPYYAKEVQTVWINGGGMLVTSSSGPKYYQERTKDVYGDCHSESKCINIPPERGSRVVGNINNTVNIQKEIGLPDYPVSAELNSGTKEEMERVTEDPTDFGGGSKDKVKCPTREDEYTKEMDKQTVRMIRAQAAWSLKQIKTPKVDLPEYALLSKSMKIMRDKCAEQVPPELFKSFLRMFRFALSESLLNHPYKQTGDQVLYDRIKSVLETCSKETGEDTNKIVFTFNNSTCPRSFEKMEFKLLKSTNQEVRECSDARPVHLRFNPCEHDLVLDVAWKTILFTHYLCSRHFAKKFQDVSTYYTVMERLYNPDMMARYYNPGRSYDGMKFVFQMYNLEKVIVNLDRCLACARSISQYRRWLKRPKDLKMCPMNGARNSPGEYDFDIEGFRGIRKNPIYLPNLIMDGNKNTYKCYRSWSDGLYTRPREKVQPSCGLNLHILGQTATYA